jgi:hypothetical protein
MTRCVALGLGLALSACSSSDSTSSNGPTVVPNAAQLETRANAIAAGFQSAPMLGLASIPPSAFAGLSHGGGTGLAALAVAPARLLGRPGPLSQRWGAVRQFMSQVRPAGHTLRTLGDAIDDTKYTTEFAINLQTGQYEDDGTKSGPADGVRYVLYAVDQNLNLDPTTIVGYADLVDQSTTNTTEIRTDVQGGTGNATTFAAFSTTITDPETSPTDPAAFGVIGHAGTANNVAFALNASDDGNGTTTLNLFAQDVSGASIQLNGTDQDDGQGTTVDQGTLTISNNQDLVAIAGSEQDVNGTPDVVDWSVSVNGTGVGTAAAYDVNGDLVWLDNDGHPMGQRDQQVLNFLFFLTFGVTFEVLLVGVGSLVIASA